MNLMDTLRQEAEDPYRDRAVGKYNAPDGGCVATTRVYDGKRQYETVVYSPDYHNDPSFSDATIVEAYDDPKAARYGHERWVCFYDNKQLPNPLVDCGNGPEDAFGVTTKKETFRK